jgi:RHS repeat-associated protein
MMKWKRLLLLLFLIPNLVHARLHEKECRNIFNQAINEDKQCATFIGQYKKLKGADGEARIRVLNDAIGCCSRAISHYDTILNDIAQQSHDRRHNGWRPQMKKDCENKKKQLVPVFNDLKTELNNTLSFVAFEKAKALHEESEKRETLASTKYQNCPPRHLNNVDAVVSVLIEVANLYEEAASKEREALAILTSAPSPKNENIVVLKQSLENYQAAANKYKEEAADWPASIAAKKVAFKEQAETLKKDSKLFTEKGLKRGCYELQKQAISILEQLIEGSSSKEVNTFKEELEQLRTVTLTFEKEADNSRLTYSIPVLSQEEFKAREKERKEFFFKSDFSLHPDLFLTETLKDAPLPWLVPLDGQIEKKEGKFSLYTEQFYRFLVQSESAIPEIFVKIHENGRVIHIETISLPFMNTLGWESYLKNGMILIPETKLKSEFGLDLRLSFSCNPKNQFSMIVAQKSTNPRYQCSLSLDPDKSLYECTFSIPPPWQLETLRKPAFTTPNQLVDQSPLPSVVTLKENGEEPHFLETLSFPVIDQLVEELKRDPLALAGYVQNEIALVDPYLYQENGVFQAPSILRNPYVTYLEGQGSPWEQCQLLVYLLRKAGYQAVYAIGDFCSLPKDFIERMLLTKLPEDQKEGLLKYPWVVFFNGNEWISLFPWMKEIQVHEGHDLYSFMPEEYATANRWILSYLKRDEKILKHIGPDGDDTAGVLFVRFIEEEMRKQGLSLSDIGIHCTQLKKQFSSWQDFPHPSIHGRSEIYHALGEIQRLFAEAKIEVYSHQNPQKALILTLPLARLSFGISAIHFTLHDNNHHHLHLQITEDFVFKPLDLDASDQLIDVKITCRIPLGSQIGGYSQSFSIAKGTNAALCSHFGGTNPKVTSQFYEQFSSERDEKKRLSTFLSFLGSAYFAKCSSAKNTLAHLHKINPTTAFAFGLSKFSPDLSKGTFKGDEDLSMPQLDMFWFQAEQPVIAHPSAWHQEVYSAHMQFDSLSTVDSSSNEHQILHDVFKDQKDFYAISTVRLLQLAHLEQQKKGLEGEGFLSFTKTSFEAADKTPEVAKDLYFPHLKDLSLRDVKASSPGQWNAIKDLLDPNNPLSSWSYAYLTPGLTLSQDGSYKEMGALILCPHTQYALISNNNLTFHGGLGSPLPSSYFAPSSISQWQLVPTNNSYMNSYALQVPFQLTSSTSSTLSNTPSTSSWPSIPSPIVQSKPGTTTWKDDVRSIFKAMVNYVGDPVDIVTGAFYIDETDLTLPGPFSLSIRRNYNSQNPLIGDLGCGWKLSLNPLLVDQDGKRFASELDGTVIVYSYNRQNNRWEVLAENNPALSNFNQRGIGSSASPFHSYIEEDVLYGADGSKRFYEDGLLQKWIDIKGNTLSFLYKDGRLSRIESSNGDFCGLHYNHEGNISEIYAKDGRRITYSYDSQGDLVKVLLPNTAEIRYEYDRYHRVIRETKPHGRVLENVYYEKGGNEGRIKEQRSPMGPQQEMVTTATFEYADGKTVVTDAEGGTTTYQIHDKQIYKIIDPLGFTTLQAWFINKESWFNPETEQVVEWNQKGGSIRSLKSTTDKRGLITSYLYDDHGNPELITLEGEDLTGSGESKVTKKLAYNENNLCVKEEICEQKIITSYDTSFPYLPKRIEKYSGKTLISYIDLDYNALGQLEKEDHSGAVTIWHYNDQGLPKEKIQLTGTEDPDVHTTYSYNHQGQCIEVISVDGTRKSKYDLMGNQIESKIFCPSGELLSATYIGYDLNNAPLWKQTANSENIVYFDYHASGLVKAKRQSLAPSRSVAYTLYEYNPCGYLIEETDPRGYITYRDYDLLGRLKSETKEKHTTLFSYEAGGLVETITSPSGGRVTRHYTTNGLLKGQIYPDGTKHTTIYDFLGRPVLETKNDIAWEIKYDDAHHRVIRTHLKTKHSEISEFDPRGNLIKFTDAAGYSSEKTYDGLNRPKTEISPSGKHTSWNYHDDVVVCRRPSGEIATTQYAGGGAIKSEVSDARGILIAVSEFNFDPENDKEEVIEGEERTITWRNTLGLPIKIEKGVITVMHEYDACGNCILSIDGGGRVTRQEFDGLGRLEKRELPDRSAVEFVYDLDSNLSEYHLPNGNVWKASYDSMHRKKSEELISSKGSSERWTFAYENGYLREARDPMQRTHTYLYDHYGRVFQDSVEGGKRTYTYEPRGFLATVNQTTDIASSWLSSWVYGSQSENSIVERSYDADGNLALESVYLNSQLIQQTKQKWTANSRSLQTGNHVRDFIYQNKHLMQVATQAIEMSYSYELSGALKSKNSRLSSTTIDYNSSGLPETVVTNLPEGPYQEQLDWYPSGKICTYIAPGKEESFSYNERGYLRSTGSEKYNFDFGSAGTGVRTAGPGWYVPQNGLDEFGRTLASVFEKMSLSTGYNTIGEVITHGQKQLSWDPWGRLTKVTDPSFSWEASYDALGRRLQTRYTKSAEQTLITNSLYDPEEEFQEIGVQIGEKTFWKIYGPDACDAISDETGASVNLMHNALRQLTGIVSPQGTLYSEKPPSFYGPLEINPSVSSDLVSYAQSLNWHSKAQDPTGFIWMGGRYYDSRSGQFLSQDPVSYPMCLDLYAYANGDPVNYFDPDGRFASPIYQPVKATVLNVWNSPQFQGGLKATTGFIESTTGAALMPTPLAPFGAAMVIHGADRASSGIYMAMTGRQASTMTSQLLQKTGMSQERADRWDNNANFVSTLLGGGLVYKFGQEAVTLFHSPSLTSSISTFSTINRPATSSISGHLLKNKLIAEEISGGHAFAKHVIKQAEFPGFSQYQFQRHIQSILNNPTEMKLLTRGRTAYWDQKTGTVVIRNPVQGDGGTAFRPTAGYDYFLKELK